MLILVVDATGRSFFSSLFVAAYIAPTALLGTVSGVIVDRMPKGVVLAASNLARAALCVLLAISTANVLTIYVIAVLFAVASQLSGPAEHAALPAIVEPGDLTAANSLNNFGGLHLAAHRADGAARCFSEDGRRRGAGARLRRDVRRGGVRVHAGAALGGAVSQFPLSIEEARERFAEAWSRLAEDTVSYSAVVMVVLASTSVARRRDAAAPLQHASAGDQRRERDLHRDAGGGGHLAGAAVCGRVAGRHTVSLTMGVSFGALVAGIAILSFVRPLGSIVADLNPLGLFDPGPLGELAARVVITGVIAAGLAFAYTLLNIVGRSVVNQRIPQDMQGRVFAAQTVLTNLASIPPILLAASACGRAWCRPGLLPRRLRLRLLALFFAARNVAAPARMAY